MNLKPKFLFFILIFLFYSNLISEIKIRSLVFNSIDDTCYFEPSTRKIILFNQNWKVYEEDNPEKKINTSLPCSFEGATTLIFEKYFYISKNEYQNNVIKLCFLGINNSVEISFNKYNIFRKYGSEIPFEIEIPKDIIKPDSKNKITLKVTFDYDNSTTIPLKSGYLLPRTSAGILRSVYLKFIPNTFIDESNFYFSFPEKQNYAFVTFESIIKNYDLLKKQSENIEDLHLEINVQPKNFLGNSQNFVFTLNDNKEIKRKFYFTIQNPVLWSPETPNLYIFKVSLYSGNQLIDEITQETGIFNFKSDNTLLLNNQPFSFKGTTYYLDESIYAKTPLQDRIINDLLLIKKSGFNSVRFAKSYPNPFALKFCQQIGLFALIELPLNSAPEEILLDNEFQIRAQNKLKELIHQYRNYSNAILIGLGSSYLADSYVTQRFIKKLLNNIDKSIFTYASFVGIPGYNFADLNFYGLELYSYPVEKLEMIIDRVNNNPEKYFISEVIYPNYVGNSSGYLIKNSTEAQAKYFELFLENISNTKLSGYFINGLFNYPANIYSLYGGYNEYYNFGLLHNRNNLNSISFRLVESIQNNKQKVTIPIGIGKSENKSFFIFIALGLSLILAILINSRKRFKEDCTRAIFRPYNFFADLRDHRILSSLYTIILMFIVAGSISLLFTIILYYLRSNILLEKILLAFGNSWLINSISYLAWHPEACFIYLLLLFLIKILILSIIIKSANIFIKTKIDFPSIFYSVIWSFFPLVLIIPGELILYRILLLNNFNAYIFIFIVLIMLWIIQRLFKGISVLFEVNSGKVYFYSFSLIIVIAGIIILYYQYTESTIYFIKNSINQYAQMLH